MNIQTHSRTLGSVLLLLTAGACALVSLPAMAADAPADALTKGVFSLDARLRWEYADQANLRASNAFTLATRFGFTSAPVDGLQGMLQGENVASLGNPDGYNAAGTNPGGAGRTVIADPPVTDLNQAWLSYAAAGTTLKAGRQRIVLDNARFVGDVGWRQNQQTFDAATLVAKPVPDLTLFYGYVWRVSRVFGNLPPQRDFMSRSHLVNLCYRAGAFGTLTAYAYLLDFSNSAANSSDTYGANWAGAAPLAPSAKLTYRIEAATQRQAGANPVHYTADYELGEVGATVAAFSGKVGYEVLGSDGGRKGFATPLATLHAFNGWADEFLATPAGGLRDAYASAGVKLPGSIPLTAIYHDFRSDVGSIRYGHEWDVLAAHQVAKHWTVLAKYARFSGDAPMVSTRKFWLQTEFSF